MAANTPVVPGAPAQAARRGPERMFAESTVKLFVNRRHCMTFLCMPQACKELAVGHLVTTQRIRSLDDMPPGAVQVRDQQVFVRIRNGQDRAACGEKDTLAAADSALSLWRALGQRPASLSGAGPLPGSPPGSPPDPLPGLSSAPVAAPVFSLPQLEEAMRSMLDKAHCYHRSGGVHSAAVGRGSNLLCYEDPGRNNALDKAVGGAWLQGLDLGACFVLLTGRISFEILRKIAAARVPLVASLNIPSDMAVEAATVCGITIVGGLLRPDRHCYTHPQRVLHPVPPITMT